MNIHSVVKQEISQVARGLQYVLVLLLLGSLTACGGTQVQSTLSGRSGVPAGPASNEIISAYELHKILTEHFGYISIKMSDTQYTLPDNSKLAQLRNSEYCQPAGGSGKEGWGCDDFAIAAMVPMRNYAFGTMYVASAAGGKQVMNVLVNNNKEIVYWEPQGCQYYQGEFDKPEFILF